MECFNCKNKGCSLCETADAHEIPVDDMVMVQKLSKEVAELKAWIKECRDTLLYPLSYENTKYGEIAECLGAATSKFLAP